MIAAAERPIFYTGGGIINSGPEASALLRELAELTGAPVTSTLMGLGAFPAADLRNGWACWACTAPTKPIWR
jgi:acetolactate synthase-1/2/3 large subunit